MIDNSKAVKSTVS